MMTEPTLGGPNPAAPFYIQLAVAAIPVVLAPMITWVLGRSKVSRETAQIDYFNKRLDFLERLNKLNTLLAEGPIRPLLDTEIELCRIFLHQRPVFMVQDEQAEAAAPQSRWARFFLTRPTVSVRKRVFKALFYFFFALSLLGALLQPIAFSLRGHFEEGLPAETFAILVLSNFLFYFLIALLFRRLAL
jgi:hypothetical protein